MGMDLYGIFLVVDLSIRDKVIKEHTEKILKALSKPCQIGAKKDREALYNYLSDELKINIPQYENDLVFDEEYLKNKNSVRFVTEDLIPDDLDETIKCYQILDAIQSDLESTKGFNMDDNFRRDMNYTDIEVRGKALRIYFAGEATNGDLPDGEGFAIFSILSKLGFSEFLQGG